MPGASSAEEKTEEPTARKEQKAREKGQVVHSSEVNSVAVLLTATLGFWLFGRELLNGLMYELTARLGNLGEPAMTLRGAVYLLRASAAALARLVMPLALGVGLVALAATVVQTGVVVAPEKISPDFSQIHPAQGLKQLFSVSALVRLLTAVGKVVVIGAVAWFVLRGRMNWLAGLVGKSPDGTLAAGASLSFLLMFWIGLAMSVVALGDYLWQRHSHHKQLMMTKTEVKEERKKDEGQPEVKRRQQERRQEMARGRMMEDVQDADVVVVNPTELAIALQWEADSAGAPVVVAKGQNLIAQRIKEIARENDVPIMERKPLARTLFKAVEIGEEIPEELYYAVARVLAFVLKERVGN